jgi:hypothetical protein
MGEAIDADPCGTLSRIMVEIKWRTCAGAKPKRRRRLLRRTPGKHLNI